MRSFVMSEESNCGAKSSLRVQNRMVKNYPTNGTNGQKLMELVEKIWNQISFHQSKSSTVPSPSTPVKNNVPEAYKDTNQWAKRPNISAQQLKVPINDRKIFATNNDMNSVKEKYRTNNSNLNHYKKSLEQMSFQQSSGTNKKIGDVQCFKCEYQFIDGRIVSKNKCTHIDQGQETKNVDTMNRNSIAKPMVESPLEANNYRLNRNETKKPVMEPERPCIIQQNSGQSIRKYVEAEIIFDQDMIGVVPLGDNHHQIQDADKIASQIEDVEKVAFLDETKPQEMEFSNDDEIEKIGEKDLNSVEKCFKKIKCLITSFTTIQTDNDRLNRLIDPIEIGFKNFDGNNIGLYKNIGYINRNNQKFIQPSRDLLKLFISDPCPITNRRIGGQLNQSDKIDDEHQSDNNLDLSQYYGDQIDDKFSRCYSKKFIYAVLDRMMNRKDGNRGGSIGRNNHQMRSKSFRYPDGEYSSDVDTDVYEATTSPGPLSINYSTIKKESSSPKPINDGSGGGAGVTPFDGQVNIRIAACCNKDVFNEKLMQALIRCNQKTTNSINNNKIGNYHETSSSSNPKRITESLQELFKLDSYFITEVSFNSIGSES